MVLLSIPPIFKAPVNERANCAALVGFDKPFHLYKCKLFPKIFFKFKSTFSFAFEHIYMHSMMINSFEAKQ